MITNQILFPTRVLHGLNAIQHLRAMYVLGESADDVIYSTCEDISRETGAPFVSLHHTLMLLTRAKIVEAKSGRYGGYYVSPESLVKHTVSDVLKALGTTMPDNGNDRASDRLHNTVADCLNISLEEFFK